MKLASIERIKLIENHSNADSLEIATVLSYKAIVKKGQYKEGDLICFIQPDTCLPDAPWAAFYKAKSNRVKAIRLRGVWSMGIVESLSLLSDLVNWKEGDEVSSSLEITKYEPPIPQDLNAKGVLPFGLTKTDEERFQNIPDLPYGEIVDVSLKIDGSSCTVYYKGEETGVTTRTMDLKLDSVNKYTTIINKFDILNKLINFCQVKNVNLALRGELYGQGIQSSVNNPYSKKELGFAVFGVWNFDTMQYEGTESEFYYETLCKQLGIETVPMIEKGVVLTPELIKKYDEDLDKIDGQPFEGVVIKLRNGTSFKVINKHYDSKK